MRRGCAAGIVLCVVTAPARADVDQCIDAHERAQQLRNGGHLVEARKALLMCSRDECPPLILADCRPWMNAARDEQPSVVLSVRDEHGTEISEVRVVIDGAEVTTRLDGRPIDIDPGEHVLRFERPNVAPIEQHVFLHVGEHAKLVAIAFQSATVTHTASRWSAAPIVLGIVAIAGIGTFAGFGISGKVAESNLAGSGCKPNCAESKIGDIRNQYIVAYASLGVGVVALAISIGLLTIPPSRTASAIQWGVTPLIGGGAATVQGRF